MSKKVLITGGAGFIGSHLVDQLLRDGHDVRVLDNLSSQVHGALRVRPDYLDGDAELLIGDVRDPDAVSRALRGVDQVCHLAAAVGVGQSMYSVDEYTSVNNFGTAVLLQALIARPVERLVVASSMSIYGEGCYRDEAGQPAQPLERSLDQLRARDWEVRDREGRPLTPVPTPETKPPVCGSVYALSKFDQERLCLMIGQAYNIPTFALRFFNVYGPRQALSNPYTGVLAIFAARLLNGSSPLLFEDGLQRRDFVSVHDVARACRLALSTTAADFGALNIGSGQSFTVRDVAERLAQMLGRVTAPELTGRYRVGDIRHCFADISQAESVLDYVPEIGFDAGLEELTEWLERAGGATDHVPRAHAELIERGLAI
jgi:dTDP-L-rhamnose 4-epimerase